MGNLNGISELRILEGYGKEAGAKALPPRRDSCRGCVDRSLAWEDHSWTLAHSVLHIRECIIVLYLGMAKEISNLPYWCISRIMTKKVAKPQNKHAVGLITTKQFTKYSWTYLLSMREKSDFVILLIHSKLFTNMAYKLKQLWAISCTEKNCFHHSSPFHPNYLQEWQFWLAAVLQMGLFWATN